MVDRKPQSFRAIEAGDVAADLDESPTEQVGAFLREARQNTGRSLADVAASLRIGAKFLQSIEDGRYEDLPGPTYAVGFIRSYADYLGLDTDALLDQFKTESSVVDGQPDLDFPVPSTVGWFPTGKVVASCAVLAVAVFGGWYYLQTDDLVDVSAVPPPPGFKSAEAKPVGARVLNAVAAAAETVESITRADNNTGATVNNGADGVAKATDQVVAATAQPAVSETDVPGATNGHRASDDGERPDQVPVPATTLESTDPMATEADLKQQQPADSVREATPPAAVATDATPASVTETPTPPPAAPPVAPPVADDAAVQVAALPSVPANSGAASSSGDGRTYGVINQGARVVIGARADSWVQVLDANQTVLLTRMLRAGDRYLVPNRNDLVMLTGNAGGLVISVDGKPVPRIGSDGAILHNVRLNIELLKAGRAVIK